MRGFSSFLTTRECPSILSAPFCNRKKAMDTRSGLELSLEARPEMVAEDNVCAARLLVSRYCRGGGVGRLQ